MAATAGQPATLVDELCALAAEVRQDLEPQDLELKELGLLIKQTTAEIDRLTPLRSDAAKRVRDVENNIEHFGRAEIAQAFSVSAEAQMRLFMMQNRLEQLEYKQRTLERNRRNLLRFIALAEQLPAATTAAPTAPAAEAGGSPRELFALVVQAEEDVRLRCAAAIHDDAAQSLANLVLRAQLCDRLLDTDAVRAHREVHDLHEAAAVALQETRRLIYDLRPLALEELGLYTSVRRYVQAATDRTAAPVDLEITGPEQRLEPRAEIALFRLIQETLSNALRHSHAAHIRVAIACADDTFRASVEDDGVGFDPPATIQAAREAKSYGLAAAMERAALLGGELTIESAPGRGTRVRIVVPLSLEGLDGPDGLPHPAR